MLNPLKLVLILIVVEDGLVHIEFAMLQWDLLVLILIVVEDGLVQGCGLERT